MKLAGILGTILLLPITAWAQTASPAAQPPVQTQQRLQSQLIMEQLASQRQGPIQNVAADRLRQQQLDLQRRTLDQQAVQRAIIDRQQLEAARQREALEAQRKAIRETTRGTATNR